MAEGKSARRRFERNAADKAITPNIALTEDDVAILRLIHQHRLIDSHAIYRLFPLRSQQTLSRRLHVLFRRHYIGRPPKQIELLQPGTGSNHIVYGLDREGARLLNERFGMNVKPYHWLQKNNSITRSNIAHTVSTTDFLVNLEVSARASKRARIIHLDELLSEYAPQSTRNATIPDRWSVDLNWLSHRGKEGTQPDRVFALEYFNLPVGKNRSFFYLEIDEGTETIEPGTEPRQLPGFFRKSSILRKFVVYSFSHLARSHEQHFGFPKPARILFLTTTSARVESMENTFRKHFSKQPLIVQPGLFLFADRNQVATAGLELLSMQWRNGAGKFTHIDDR